MGHAWFENNRAAFATRALEADEERSFVEHLAHCPECRLAIEQIARELSWLPMAVPAAAVRPGLQREIAARILDGGPTIVAARSSSRVRYAVLSALAASLLLTVGVVASKYRSARHEVATLTAALQNRDRDLALFQDSLALIRRASRVLDAAVTRDGRTGRLIIFADNAAQRWTVVLNGLPPAPAGQVYQFWFICADGIVKGAILRGSLASPASVTLDMPPGGGGVMGAALTLETVNARATLPRGIELAHVML